LIEIKAIIQADMFSQHTVNKMMSSDERETI
jgi:hypothetical protein